MEFVPIVSNYYLFSITPQVRTNNSISIEVFPHNSICYIIKCKCASNPCI